MRGASQERECSAKCIKAGMEKKVLSGSVDLMAIDQMGYHF